MKIDIISDEASCMTLSLEGDLDFHAATELRNQLANIPEKKPPKILVNLKRLQYIDSTGLAVFVELFQKVKAYNGKLAFFGLTSPVRKIFKSAKLDSLFKIAKTEKEAAAV